MFALEAMGIFWTLVNFYDTVPFLEGEVTFNDIFQSDAIWSSTLYNVPLLFIW